MRYLLDTHTFLWMISQHPNLSAKASQIILDPQNDLFFSSVSGFEIAIKYSLGKLALPSSPREFIPLQVQINKLILLPVQMEHGLYIAELPNYHNDPFDRLLIPQAILEDMILLTKDVHIESYPVKVAW